MSLNSLKKRIVTAKSISKITNAMKLMASGKLQKQKNIYLKTKDYYSEYYAIIGKLIGMCPQFKKDAKKTLHIIITSQLGLCGGYNSNIIKQALKEIKETDYLLQIGKRGKEHIIKTIGSQRYIEYDEININGFNYMDVAALATYIINMINENKIDSVTLHYTKFINAISFMPTSLKLIPFDEQITSDSKQLNVDEYDFEPSKEKIIETIIPSYLASVIYGSLIESTISENASRRNAMDTATDNSKDLINQLQIKYNRLRQSKITEEITEIISGSKTKE